MKVRARLLLSGTKRRPIGRVYAYSTTAQEAILNGTSRIPLWLGLVCLCMVLLVFAITFRLSSLDDLAGSERIFDHHRRSPISRN
ncbi:uncharacterized protein BDW70DRAFT_126064 [Aspergillus foveolatus]|uniref:uncharacterized protein n=1 Tax=Aspergillus foveolatus TaxID=210207 RepID=UPI003CCD488D